MFDWEDQEIANIIWGEADDHIVTYPEESEKKSHLVQEDHGNSEANEEAANSKPSEQKPAATNTDLQGDKLERNDDRSILASISDLNSIGQKTDPDKGPEMSENQNEAGDLGDITGNNWVNIESFDDLDHIFSNDELGDHASLDSTDEFWAPSRDVLDSAVKSSSLALDSTSWDLEALGSSSGQFDFNYEYLNTENEPYISAYEKEADSACCAEQVLNLAFDQEDVDTASGQKLILEKTAVDMAEKTISEPQIVSRKIAATNKSSNKRNWSRSQSKHELKSENMNNHRRVRDAYNAWPPPAVNVQQVDAKSVPDTTKNYLPSALDQQKMPQQSTSLAYQQFSNPYFATYSYGTLPDQCTAMSILPATDDEHQPVLLNTEACLSDKVYRGKSTSAPLKPQKMTPQEKIEKLRKRQQLRAMLAIQKQQQQLSHPAPITDYSIPQKSSQEDPTLHLEKTDFKGEESIIPIYDPNSPPKQDDSSTISVEVDDHNIEDTVLYQLQDTVTKLDTNTRLCIRDSLFRLAQSAMQRHCTSESSSGKGSIGCGSNAMKEDLSNPESFMRLPSAETETNSIDRAVAHLLFHRPFKSSLKQIGTPESSIPPKIPPDLKAGTSSSLPLSCVTKSPKNEQNISANGAATPRAVKEPQQDDLPDQPDADESINQKMKQKMVEIAD